MKRRNMTDDEQVLAAAHAVRLEGYATWPLDRLLLNPGEALRLCGQTRRLLPYRLRERATDETILRLLLNQRKRGKAKARRDQTKRDGPPAADKSARRKWAGGPPRRR